MKYGGQGREKENSWNRVESAVVDLMCQQMWCGPCRCAVGGLLNCSGRNQGGIGVVLRRRRG